MELTWRKHAACSGLDPVIFYPPSELDEDADQAKAVCGACPVRHDCLEHALSVREKDGVWGGATEKERRRIIRQRRRADRRGLRHLVPPDFAELGGWPATLGTITAGGSLTTDVAQAAMAEILEGAATPSQIAGLIVALRMKGETVDELTGLVRAMLAAAEPVALDHPEAAIDIVGTGGDKAHTINVSTISGFVVAGAGAKVCKHGNRAASSACGSADLLEALGVVIDLGPEGVARCVEGAGMGFCFAPRFHAAMRYAGPTRSELGVPTVFNFLGPMANPARVRRLVIGVADPSLMERMLAVLAANGAERALVVHGHDGLDELTTTTTSSALELRDGDVVAREIDPAAFGLRPAAPGDLRGGDASHNAALARAVLAGEPGAHRDVILLNAAAGMVVAGLADDLAGGIDLAARSIDSGAAAGVVDALVEVSSAVRAAEGR